MVIINKVHSKTREKIGERNTKSQGLIHTLIATWTKLSERLMHMRRPIFAGQTNKSLVSNLSRKISDLFGWLIGYASLHNLSQRSEANR